MLKGIHKLKRTNAKGQTVYYYYAWRGGPRIEAKYGTEEFIIEYAGHKRRLESSNIETIDDLIRDFEASEEFEKLTVNTKESHLTAFKHIRAGFDDLPISLIGQPGLKKEIRDWRNKFKDKPRSADAHLNTFKRLFSYGVEQEYFTVNPAAGIKSIYEGSRKDSIWTPDQIEKMRENAPEPIVRAMMLAYYTGQRQGDLLALKWSDYDGIHLKLRQSKGGKYVKVRVHAKLKIYIDSLDRTAIRILTNSYGRPWTQSGFRSSFRKACKRVDVTGVTFHDLRGTFITERRREGSTAEQIASVSGHSLSEVKSTLEKHYLAEDQQTSDAVILRMK